MMVRHISSKEARNNAGDQKSEKQHLFQTIQEIQERNCDKDPEEMEADIAAAVEDVRQEDYDNGLSRLTPTS